MNDNRKVAGSQDYLGPDRSSGSGVGDLDPEGLLSRLEAPKDRLVLSLDARTELVSRARRERATRRRRIGIFGSTMFGEAGWEVLLALYVDQDARRTIAQVGKVVTSAPTTMLRWIDYLESQQLIRRRSHPTDARAVLIELTDKALNRLDQYFSETLKAET